VYTHLIKYTKEFEKKNPQFPPNIYLYLDRDKCPTALKERSILEYNREFSENCYWPLTRLEIGLPPAVKGGEVEIASDLDPIFRELMGQWENESNLAEVRWEKTDQRDIPNWVNLVVLEQMLIGLFKLKENLCPTSPHWIDSELFGEREWGGLLVSCLSSDFFWTCYRQTKTDELSLFSTEFGAVTNFFYIRLLRELGEFLEHFFLTRVQSLGPRLTREVQKKLWAAVTIRFEEDLNNKQRKTSYL